MVEDERCLVVGRSGWLGQALWRRLTALATTVEGPPSTELDVRSAAAVAHAMDTVRPTAVFNLAAAQPGSDEAALRDVNVIGARVVAEACARSGARLVHVSTDALLDGRAAPYDDDAPASPLTPYGRSKARGEAAVLAAHPAALCVRTSLLWDPTMMDRGTQAYAKRLAAGEPCRLFTDEIRCPLTRTALAAALVDLASLRVSGTLNVAGREPLSRHDFARLLLQHFGVPGLDRIERVRAADLERAGAAPRPRDLRLVLTKAEALLARRMQGVTAVLREQRDCESPQDGV